MATCLYQVGSFLGAGPRGERAAQDAAASWNLCAPQAAHALWGLQGPEGGVAAQPGSRTPFRVAVIYLLQVPGTLTRSSRKGHTGEGPPRLCCVHMTCRKALPASVSGGGLERVSGRFRGKPSERELGKVSWRFSR